MIRDTMWSYGGTLVSTGLTSSTANTVVSYGKSVSSNALWAYNVKVGIIGQSNARHEWLTYNLATTFDSTLKSNGIKCVEFFNAALAGWGLHEDTGTDSWSETDGTAWSGLTGALTAIGGDCDYILFIGGETDAIDGDITASMFTTAMATLETNLIAINGLRNDVRLVATILGRGDGTAEGTDATWNGIRKGLVDWSLTTSIGYIAATAQSYVNEDPDPGQGVHWDTSSNLAHQAAIANFILYDLGIRNDYEGPRCSTISRVSATTIDVTISHNGGTDFTPTSGIAGFEVYTGSWISATGARQDANTIRLTHDSGTVTDVRYMCKKNNPTTSVVDNNSDLGLPMLYNNSVDPHKIRRRIAHHRRRRQ